MLREGNINIARYDGEVFDLEFARNDWSGVMKPRRIRGREALISFLNDRLRFTPDVVNHAISQLDAQRSAHLPRVQLTDQERFDLGLVAPSEGICRTS